MCKVVYTFYFFISRLNFPYEYDSMILSQKFYVKVKISNISYYELLNLFISYCRIELATLCEADRERREKSRTVVR